MELDKYPDSLALAKLEYLNCLFNVTSFLQPQISKTTLKSVHVKCIPLWTKIVTNQWNGLVGKKNWA